jgi:trans-aconitate methyltransferase
MTQEQNKKSLLRQFLDANIWLSRKFDTCLPEKYNAQGNGIFRTEVAKPYIAQRDIIIYDLGGGSRPYITPKHKAEFNQTIFGLDIDGDELADAPQGSYDDAITADLTTYNGQGDGDLVICQAALEHVNDNDGSFRAMASVLKSGGVATIFTPSRNAVFARLNMILPQKLKQKILFTLFPHKAEGHDGFKAYYDQCTPKKFRKLADKMDSMLLS